MDDHKIFIPQDTKHIMKILKNKGYESYVVGISNIFRIKLLTVAN